MRRLAFLIATADDELTASSLIPTKEGGFVEIDFMLNF
jgi:hypothetical protein